MGTFSELEKMAPGSVQVSKDGRSVTLIGWHLEMFDDSEHHKREPVLPNKSGLEVIETLTNEEIQKARGAAERIAASFGFYVRKPGISPEERLAPTEEKSYE